MGFSSVFLISLGLSADAFAASVVRGLQSRRALLRSSLAAASAFGFFQGAMALLGFFLGSSFSVYVARFDNYLAAALLFFVGTKALFGALEKSPEKPKTANSGLIPTAFATSVDAFATGVAFSFDKGVRIFAVSAVIAITAFAVSLVGVMLGTSFGVRFQKKAQILGAAILIAMAFGFLFG